MVGSVQADLMPFCTDPPHEVGSLLGSVAEEEEAGANVPGCQKVENRRGLQKVRPSSNVRPIRGRELCAPKTDPKMSRSRWTAARPGQFNTAGKRLFARSSTPVRFLSFLPNRRNLQSY